MPQWLFAATHGFILDLIARGKVNGVRIDHPDGLYDPAQYLRRLQAGLHPTSPSVDAVPQIDKYVIVEKVLTNEEHLASEWPVDGTTGYDFANLVSSLLVDSSTAVKMERNYRAFLGKTIDFPDLVYRCKRLILDVSLASELNTLANALSKIALSNRHTCDFTLNSLRRALAEIIANFPVYRTYINGNPISDKDRRYVEYAMAMSKGKSRARDVSIFDFVERLLLMEPAADPERSATAIRRFAMKLQQLTSAVMAKGVEDTALYRYHRLISLNDVGSNPMKFGASIAEFHRASQQRAEHWPNSLVTTSTHDSKRSEDVRARIAVLSEMPALFRLNVGRWAKLNRSKKRVIEGQLAPTRNDEYLFYQTLVGTLPFAGLKSDEWAGFSERIERYMLKALREAKEFTSWANANADYEAATVDFVRSALKPGRKNRFLDPLYAFQGLVAQLGMLNSLSQTLLKLTSPGIPDIYQGNELWDFSLADPDNRRSVNYAHRQQLLLNIQNRAAQLAGDAPQFCRELVETMEDGRIKLYLTWKTLCYRNQKSILFREGAYRPLEVRGTHTDRVCAFGRIHGEDVAVIVAARLWAGLLDGAKYAQGIGVWQDTRIELPGLSLQPWHNIFTNDVLRGNPQSEVYLSDVLRNFPVGLLIGQSAAPEKAA
jgi:(1->4)-alpha-D-glucan 1-alpha-D-glucosylmutase